MSASDSMKTGPSIREQIARLRVLFDRITEITYIRWMLFITGIVSVGYGQYLIEQRTTGKPLPQAELWNDLYRLQIVNFDDALRALPFLIGGAFLCALTVLPLTWKTSTTSVLFDLQSNLKVHRKEIVRAILFGTLLFLFLIVQLARHEGNSFYIAVWLVSVTAFAFAAWRWDRNEKKDLSLDITSLDLFWIASLLLLGFVINSFALVDIPTILVPDEGSFWETARAIALKEIHPSFFDSGVYTFPVASSIYQGWIVRIFGLNMWSWRFSSVIAGVIAVIPLYLLCKEWFNHPTAIASSVMMISNPYFIAFARMGYNNSQALFPVILSIYFFALSMRKGSVFFLFLAGMVAGFGFYTYSATWLGLVTLVLGALYLFVSKQIDRKQMMVGLGVILLAWGIVFAPRVAYTASGENSPGLIYKIFETSFVNTFYAKAYYGESDLLQTSPFISFSEHDTIFYDPQIYKELLIRGTVRTLLALLDPHIVREHFLITGFAGTISPVFFLIGLSLALRFWKQMRFGVLLIWFTAGLLSLSIIAAFPPRQTHLVSVIPVLAIVSGIGLSISIEYISALLLSHWIFIRSIFEKILLTVAIVVIGYFGIQKYFISMPGIYPPSFEDITSWIAWKTETSSDLIYLSQGDQPHRVKYLVDTKLAPHNYQAFTFDNFLPETDLPKNTPAIIFIENNDKVLESMFRELPGYTVPIPYSYKDGTILGYVVTNTAIDINPSVDWEEDIRSLVTTPVKWILIPLVFIMIATGWAAFSRRQTALKHQTRLQGVQ